MSPRMYQVTILKDRNLLVKERLSETSTHLLFQISAVASLASSVCKKRALMKAWYDFITEYSGSELSFESDKLVAISSVAELVGGALHDKNAAKL